MWVHVDPREAKRGKLGTLTASDNPAKHSPEEGRKRVSPVRRPPSFAKHNCDTPRFPIYLEIDVDNGVCAGRERAGPARLGLFTCCLIGAAAPIALCMKLKMKNTDGEDRKIRHAHDKRFRTLEMFILSLVAGVHHSRDRFSGMNFMKPSFYTSVSMAVSNVNALKVNVEDRTVD